LLVVLLWLLLLLMLLQHRLQQWCEVRHVHGHCYAHAPCILRTLTQVQE
jgi:hypothetical protein